MYSQIQAHYNDLEVVFYSLQEESQEALELVNAYDQKLQAADQAYVSLNEEFQVVNEILKENKTELGKYVSRMQKLEEKIQIVQRQQQRNFIRSILWFLLTIVIGCIAVIIALVLKIYDIIYEQQHPDVHSDWSGRSRRYFRHQQEKFETFLDDLERRFHSSLVGK